MAERALTRWGGVSGNPYGHLDAAGDAYGAIRSSIGDIAKGASTAYGAYQAQEQADLVDAQKREVEWLQKNGYGYQERQVGTDKDGKPIMESFLADKNGNTLDIDSKGNFTFNGVDGSTHAYNVNERWARGEDGTYSRIPNLNERDKQWNKQFQVGAAPDGYGRTRSSKGQPSLQKQLVQAARTPVSYAPSALGLNGMGIDPITAGIERQIAEQQQQSAIARVAEQAARARVVG